MIPFGEPIGVMQTTLLHKQLCSDEEDSTARSTDLRSSVHGAESNHAIVQLRANDRIPTTTATSTV